LETAVGPLPSEEIGSDQVAHVAKHILSLIKGQPLHLGDPIPSEVQTARELGVSRGSVREAYRSLSAVGIIDVGAGRVPRLQSLDSAVFARLIDYALTTAQVDRLNILETRRAIGMQCANLAARYATSEQRLRLSELLANLHGAGASVSDQSVIEEQIHLLIASSAGNPLNEMLLRALWASNSSQHDLGEHQGHRSSGRIYDSYSNLIDRVCAGDGVGASAAMSVYFDIKLKTA
jgi:GntR family transcriptional regulator, transcriptional repressor for pyruvate dehydrogenase complex